jgi:LmbE family N-acetylglucosaminyl deacetylase
MAEGALSGKSMLGVFAHPDDETYSIGGCMARYGEEGVVSTVLSFTRGEAGQIGGGVSATRETLGAVREAELREACRLCSCMDVRFVGTPDSGTKVTEEGIQAIVDVLRELKPEILVSMEPEGITRHPDHIAVSQMTTEAFERVREEGYVKRLFLSAEPTASLKGWMSELERRGLQWISKDDPLYPQPSPDQSIACIVDVTPWLATKAAALKAHVSQSDEIVSWLPEEMYAMTIGAEAFQRVYPPKAKGEIVVTDLFDGLREG